MDLTKYDARGAAERGVFVALCDPYTGEPIEKNAKKAPGFMVRGMASRTTQSRLAEMQRKPVEADGEQAHMEALHDAQIGAAMPYIISAVNIEVDGKEVGDDETLIRKALDLTFPDLQIVRDQDGDPVMVESEDKDGKLRKFPKFEVVNKTFAAQVTDRAGDTKGFLGRT